jgi:hypothetical protein
MRIVLVLVAVGFSTAAFAQSPPPVSGKALAHARPKEPIGCKLVGTVRGTKLWAGDCTLSNDLRGAVPATEIQPLAERATGVIPPSEKQ